MAAHGDEISQLKTQLETDRWKIYQGIQNVEDKLNVPRRVRHEFAEHPVKWVAVSAGVGFLASKVVPMLLGRKKRGFVGRALTPLVRAGMAAAMPILAHKAAAWLTERGVTLPTAFSTSVHENHGNMGSAPPQAPSNRFSETIPG